MKDEGQKDEDAMYVFIKNSIVRNVNPLPLLLKISHGQMYLRRYGINSGIAMGLKEALVKYDEPLSAVTFDHNNLTD